MTTNVTDTYHNIMVNNKHMVDTREYYLHLGLTDQKISQISTDDQRTDIW